MFDGNNPTPLEVIESRLSNALNGINHSIALIRESELSRTEQKTIRRGLTSARDSINKVMLIIDEAIAKQGV